MRIHSNPGDFDPKLFGLGETHDASWNGPGGFISLKDTVVRNDAAPGEGELSFSKGWTRDGDLTQVAWSRNFDLEGRHYDNFDGNDSPGFFTTD